jgi:large subunit ribosomal protein L29
MRASEVHSMSDVEVVEKLREARQEAFNLRLRHATGELENTANLRGAKRDVARLLTIARQRKLDTETRTDTAE